MLSFTRITNKYARNLSYLGTTLQTLTAIEFSWSGYTFILSKISIVSSAYGQVHQF